MKFREQNIPTCESVTEFNNITISTNDSSLKLNEKRIQSIVHYILDIYNLGSYELHINFVTATEMTRLNSAYRSIDRVTDVLSFPQLEFEEPAAKGGHPVHGGFHPIMGDLVICVDAAIKNAKTIGHSAEREIAFLLVHGILHLCGYDHKDPEQERVMIKEQNTILDQLAANEKDFYRDMLHKSSEII